MVLIFHLSPLATLSMGTFALERFKFGVYLIIPVIAVVAYSFPVVHENSLRWSRYVVNPPNDLPLGFTVKKPAPAK